MPELLGVDNVMLAVRDLDAAVRFYEACGFTMKFRLDQAGMALFGIGGEAPGLLVRAGAGGGPGDPGTAGAGRFWVEVRDADAVAAELNAAGIATGRLETMTGITVEATDPSGNVVGFADYSKRPEMARA
jgi:catechol 2,3-dioxygenase-like lactoylglutathione lyase family enzyme